MSTSAPETTAADVDASELTEDELQAQALADAASAAALAGEDVAAAAEQVEQAAPAPAREPRSRAARRAAGEPAVPSSADQGGDPGGATVASSAPAPGPTAEQAASRANSLGLPDAMPGEEAPLTPAELDLIKRIRRTRSQEIRDAIASAPRHVGTDIDQYTLVHLRGCPQPDRTETYEQRNSSTGQLFTVHRCIECGAHQAIPH